MSWVRIAMGFLCVGCWIVGCSLVGVIFALSLCYAALLAVAVLTLTSKVEVELGSDGLRLGRRFVWFGEMECSLKTSVDKATFLVLRHKERAEFEVTGPRSALNRIFEKHQAWTRSSLERDLPVEQTAGERLKDFERRARQGLAPHYRNKPPEHLVRIALSPGVPSDARIVAARIARDLLPEWHAELEAGAAQTADKRVARALGGKR